MYVLDKEKGKIVEKEITFTPGLYKIFDEYVSPVYLPLALLLLLLISWIIPFLFDLGLS